MVILITGSRGRFLRRSDSDTARRALLRGELRWDQSGAVDQGMNLGLTARGRTSRNDLNSSEHVHSEAAVWNRYKTGKCALETY
jgi:hypothetical protein